MKVCIICNEEVHGGDMAEKSHLQHKHTLPPTGFSFYFDGKKYKTDKPSMTAGELIKLTDRKTWAGIGWMAQDLGPPDYKTIYHHSCNAIDLTRTPDLYWLLPATY